MILAALVATAITSCNMRQALALDVPPPLEADAKAIDFFQEARIGKLPGVEDVAVGNFVRWRDAGIRK